MSSSTSTPLPAAPDAPTEPATLAGVRLPRRFFLGTFALYAIFLGTFLLAASPLHDKVPRGADAVVPLLAGFSFYLAGNLFLIILGRGNVSRWTVLICMLSTLVAAAALCVTLRAGLVYPALDPDSAPAMRALLKRVAEIVNRYALSAAGQFSYLKLIFMVIVEETVKLIPLMLLIAAGRIRTAHGAMLCGALAGLTFGIVEGISFGYLDYPAYRKPITTYLTRFLVMSQQHAVWDALAGGIIFFVGTKLHENTQRRPTAFACAVGFAWAVIFHTAHNGLQAMLGPYTQIATVFGLMMPLYLLSKAARRRSAAEGVDYSKQLVGDLHALTLSVGTLFLAGSLGFSRTAGRTARLLEDQWALTASIRKLDDANDRSEVEAARVELLRGGFSSGDPELFRIRDRSIAAAATLAQQDEQLHFLGGPSRGGGTTFTWGRDGISARAETRSIACRAPYLLLDECRQRLNRFAARRDLPRPYAPIGRWRVSVRGVTLSAVAARRCERDEPDERAAPDPQLILGVRKGDGSAESFYALARSETPASDTLHAAFSPPWSGEACFFERQPVLMIVDDDGVDASGEVLDVVELPARGVDGELTARDGSIVSLKIDYESH